MSCRIAFVALLALAATAGLASSSARAMPKPYLPTVWPPQRESGGRLAIEDAWRVDCRQLAVSGTCLVTVTSRSVGAGSVVVAGANMLDGEDAVKLDGVSQWLVANDGGGDASAVRIEMGPGEHVLVVARRVPMSTETSRGWIIPADEARHLLLHDGRPPASRALSVQLTPASERANGYAFDLAVLRDTSFIWTTPIDPFDPPWTSAGGVEHLRVAPGVNATMSRLVSFDDVGEPFHWGGPMVGVGVGFRGDGSFRMRFEYEAAVNDWILPGISLDADTVSGWVLAPRVEIASPIALILPSFSVGIGLPIKLEPDPDAGVRFLVGGSFGPIGLIASFDLYPRSEGDLIFEPALLLRGSL